MTSTPIAKVNQTVLAALRSKNIARVEIDYDGEGDTGQIADIWAVDAADHPVSLDRPITVALDPDKPAIACDSLHEALDAFAWLLLAEYHNGYENNDGGFGTIVIDVAKNSTTIDHNDRITDVVNTTTEV
jgi:rhodanese-related sulfurtransferase